MTFALFEIATGNIIGTTNALPASAPAGYDWAQLDDAESEFLATNQGERPKWVPANPIGTRVTRNPWPRLQFRDGANIITEYELTTADPPKVLEVRAVDIDGNLLNVTVTRQLDVSGTVRRFVRVSVVNGIGSVRIPTNASREFIVGNVQKGFRIWNGGFVARVVEPETATNPDGSIDL